MYINQIGNILSLINVEFKILYSNQIIQNMSNCEKSKLNIYKSSVYEMNMNMKLLNVKNWSTKNLIAVLIKYKLFFK